MKRVTLFLAALGLLALASGAPAKADLVYTLNVSGCTGGCSPGPFATVDLAQVNSTTVSVTETLENGAKFVATGAGDALEFNILGHPTIVSDVRPTHCAGP